MIDEVGDEVEPWDDPIASAFVGEARIRDRAENEGGFSSVVGGDEAHPVHVLVGHGR